MKIAILGGTFNPPHFGHLFFANEVRQKLGYDKIVFVPSNISAHKQQDKSISTENRIEMLKLSIKNLQWADVSLCDINRGGITRTVDTIEDIKIEFSLIEKPGFIIGDDLIKGFNNWKDPDKIAELADLIVGIRDLNEINLKYHYKSINNRIFPLSSSEIRERVLKGIDIDFLLPEDVIKYIKNNGLYRNN
jgi:nicotinate-nucleotide adenylyltransferase